MNIHLRWLYGLTLALLMTGGLYAHEPVVYYTFNHLGPEVLDVSGFNHHGVPWGALALAPGLGGQAMAFDGGTTYVRLPNVIGDDFTLMCWIRTDLPGREGNTPYGGSGLIWSAAPGTVNDFVLSLVGTKLGLIAGNPNTSVLSETDVTTGEWVHVTAIRDRHNAQLALYINSQFEADIEYANTALLTANPKIDVGANTSNRYYYKGLMDEVKIFDGALSSSEIISASDVSQGYPFAVAPSPADGQEIATRGLSLSWQAGDFAAAHRIYLSENRAAVVAGDPNVAYDAGAGLLTVGFPGHPLAEGLTPGSTYYWRVDEVNDQHPASPWDGPVWKFSLPPETAHSPFPAQDAVQFVPDQALTWQAGIDALLHTVYFGTDADQVAQASGGKPQAKAHMTPSNLLPDTTYYWRVDEITMRGPVMGSVWSFTTAPAVSKGEASLLGWWKLDNDQAAAALDYSGQDRHGLMAQAPTWISENSDTALQLDGSYIKVPPLGSATDTLTVTAWIRPAVSRPTGLVVTRTAGTETGLFLNAPDNQLGYRWQGSNGDWASGLFVPTDSWSFVALVVEADTAQLYLNHVDVWSRFNAAHANASFDSPLLVGAAAEDALAMFNGGISDVRVYQRALTDTELQQVKAAGQKASASDPMVIDNFDRYSAYASAADPNVWDVWWDGYGGNQSGATVGHLDAPYMESFRKVAGRHALPLYYDNDGTFMDFEDRPVSVTHSEIIRTLAATQDFTRHGAQALSFWIRGDRANTAMEGDQLELILTDRNGQSATAVVVPMETLLLTTWQQVVAPLSTVQGLDLTQIKEITFRIGSPGQGSGGTGVVFLDELELLPIF